MRPVCVLLTHPWPDPRPTPDLQKTFGFYTLVCLIPPDEPLEQVQLLSHDTGLAASIAASTTTSPTFNPKQPRATLVSKCQGPAGRHLAYTWHTPTPGINSNLS